MAEASILQEWVNVGATSAVGVPVPVKQAESGYADLRDYEDLVAYVEVSAVSGTAPTLTLESSPTKDEFFFTAVASMTMTVGTNTLAVDSATAALPVARYLRWRVSSSTTYFATFRIILSLSS